MAQPQEGDLVGGRYRLLRASGARWRARDEDSGEQVSLERTRVSSAQDAADRVAAFDRRRTEHARRRAAAQRSSANLVLADELVADQDVLWSVTRLVEGRTLEEDVAAYGPVPETTATPIAEDLLRALAVAHREGIAHGGVSPQVVRLTGSGEAVLTGFDTPLGDPAYRAPEHDEEAPTAAGDVHALGTTLQHALTGRQPGQADDAPAGELGRLIARMRGADPARRPSAAEALRLLQAPAAEPPATIAEPTETTPYRVLPVVGVLVAIGLLLVSIIGISQVDTSDDSTSDSDEASTTTSSYDSTSSYDWDESDSYEYDSTETTTSTTDSTEEAFEDVEEGSCLPVYQDGEGEWNTSTPPDAVPCNDKTAGVFKVISTSLDSSECTSGSSDYVPWSYTGDSGYTTTLCLDRVWVPRYCVLAETTPDGGVQIGTTTAVDCDETELPGHYNTVLVVSSVKNDPNASCASSSSDTTRYFSLPADEGASLVCLTFPA
ncbi:hypothetical protein QFW96_27015 [Saccharopolyspora sp. TS4A08]|uniref:non-specific serine/threonine protein kinase n=1 Tax=Saccharopolyspora ipomoeae TaxID=3042027 RepID=A0ABT6PWA5_9PSEU|nr:hypothetical protein [Saccharopolyspora sp. TS4A08]MDI2032299.1 hypothetical protein [Saccharopolyspora sp. TS4A08]